MRVGRIIVLVAVAVLAIAACDRVVDLTPPTDAARGDVASSGDSGTDGGGTDSGFDGGGLPDAGSVPDGFTGD